VPAERIDSIFDPFLQVDADLTRMRQGTGLGLSIARQLARGMSGEITVQSEPGAGSTFTLRLPLADGRTEGAAAVPPPA
jgi:signal transduction histidine kinase